MGRRLAISDIHGEGHRLLQVLDKAHYEPGTDRLFLLGDYVDRGTDSNTTVQLVQMLVELGAVALKGNHDDWMWRNAAGIQPADFHGWIEQGGWTTLRDYQGWPPDSVTAWLAGLPFYIEEPDCILVHGGLKPGIPLNEQSHHDMLWIRREFHNNYRGKRVIFGHSPTSWITGDPNFLDIWHGPDKTGIDTGAAYGGRLTLYDLDTHQTWWA